MSAPVISTVLDTEPGPDPDAALLDVAGLSVRLAGGTTLVSDVSFSVSRGETLGIVGESGSGKTLTALSITGVLPNGIEISHGSVTIDGQRMVGRPRRELERIRGRLVGTVFQDATRSLNPAFTIGDQLAEVARRHLGMSRRSAHARALELLAEVGINNPPARAKQYPHQFSGGMCQRAMIAMALVCEPRLLIADEPTTGLDVTVQAKVLELLLGLQERMNLGLLFITHDLGVVAEVCDRVAVMYAGQVVEEAPVDDLFNRPTHPYTSGLLGAIPDAQQRSGGFRFIRGTVPAPADWPSGCRFHPRCDFAEAGRCTEHPVELTPAGDVVRARCVRGAELDLGRTRPP